MSTPVVRPSAVYNMKLVRVVCPECGAGSASPGPCYCHKCSYDVLMLPYSGVYNYNWLEHQRYTKGEFN